MTIFKEFYNFLLNFNYDQIGSQIRNNNNNNKIMRQIWWLFTSYQKSFIDDE